MAIWLTKVTAGDILTTIAPPGAFGYDPLGSAVMYWAFVAEDLIDERYPTIKVFYRPNGSDFETFEQHGFSLGGDAQAGFVPHGSGTSAFVGADEFETGGTLTIVKDETAEEYQFTGVVGTSAVPFSVFSGGVNEGELAPMRVFVQTGLVSTLNGDLISLTTHDTALTVRWSDFFGQLDGNDIKGATLATGDRGSWLDPSGSFDPWFVSATAATTPAIADTGSAVGFSFSVDADDPEIGSSGVAFLDWDQSVYLVEHNPANLALDTVLCPVSGRLYVLRVADTEEESVFFAFSVDQGATWQEQALDTIGGAVMGWPTLDVSPTGKILAMWQDRNEPDRRYWTISETFGETWGTVQSGIVAAFSAARARFSPQTGLLYLVYRDPNDGRFEVVAYQEVTLAGFVAADPWSTPRAVQNATADSWPALIFSQRGVLQLQWADMQRNFSVSDSNGIFWTTTMDEPMTEKAQPAVVSDNASGLQYTVYQHPMTGDLTAFASADGGVTPVSGGPGGTVIAGIDQQYVGIVTDHAGRLYVPYQALDGSSYELRCRKSITLSATWSDA